MAKVHWVEVDLPQVIEQKAKVLPVIDNYRLVGANFIKDDWLSLTGWKPDQPLLVLMEGVAPEPKGNLLVLLIERLGKHLGSAKIEIVFDDRNSCLVRWLKNLAIRLRVKFKVPLVNYIARLQQQGFQITRQTSLPGNSATGMVINYQGHLF